MVEKFVRRAGRAGSGQTLTGQALTRASFTIVRTWILDEAVWALREALCLMKEQVIADAAARAGLGGARARQTGRVTELAALVRLIEEPISCTFSDACVFLKLWTATVDVHRLGVAAQADTGLARWTRLARVVTVRVDGQAVLELVYEVVEGVVHIVECSHLEAVRLNAGVGSP